MKFLFFSHSPEFAQSMHSRAFECAFTHGFKRLKERSRVFPIRLTSDDETEDEDDDDDDTSFSEYPMKALFLSIFARAVSGATNSNDDAKRKQKTTRIFYNERFVEKKKEENNNKKETRCARNKKHATEEAESERHAVPTSVTVV
jgi:hypothetical protein